MVIHQGVVGNMIDTMTGADLHQDRAEVHQRPRQHLMSCILKLPPHGILQYAS
jgi:hypothetical protein